MVKYIHSAALMENAMPPRVFSDEVEQEIIKSYTDGMSSAKVARKFNSYPPTILTILKRHNISRRNQSDCQRKFSLDKSAFDKLDNEHACYWLGFIFADGTVSKGRNQLTVTIQNSDRDHLEKLRMFLKTDKPVSDFRQIYKGELHISATMLVRDWHLADRLRELGVEPHRPNPLVCVKSVPDELKKHWIRGWFDGDGSIFTGKDGGTSTNFLGRKDLLEFISRWFSIKCNSTKRNISPKAKNLHYMTYGKKDSIKIGGYMYEDASVYLDRKKVKFFDLMGR